MAQEQATEAFYDFMHGKYLLKRLYGVDLDEIDYLEDAFMVWRQIGNIAVAHHAFEVVIPSDNIIQLPCNCEFIESVTTGDYRKDLDGDFIIWYDSTSLVTNPNSFLPGIKLDNSMLLKPISHTELHPKGDYIPYELVLNSGHKSIRVDSRYSGSRITVIYRGIIMDDEGNPCITRKESEAIAHKIGYMDTQLGAFKGDPIKTKMLGVAKSESGRAMQAAKIPEYLSQNFLDQLLSTMTRHDRKVFNSSYKTMR